MGLPSQARPSPPDCTLCSTEVYWTLWIAAPVPRVKKRPHNSMVAPPPTVHARCSCEGQAPGLPLDAVCGAATRCIHATTSTLRAHLGELRVHVQHKCSNFKREDDEEGGAVSGLRQASGQEKAEEDSQIVDQICNQAVEGDGGALGSHPRLEPLRYLEGVEGLFTPRL